MPFPYKFPIKFGKLVEGLLKFLTFERNIVFKDIEDSLQFREKAERPIFFKEIGDSIRICSTEDTLKMTTITDRLTIKDKKDTLEVV